MLSRALPFALILAVSFLTVVSPKPAMACACGCGVFEVKTSSMLPVHPGGMAFVEYDFMNQSRNWSGTSSAPADHNDDKKILTHFLTVGYQQMFGRKFGLSVAVPYWSRSFRTLDDGGSLMAFNHSAIGDIRIRGIYSGFSPDMTTGVTFGFKLANGDSSYPNFDSDTEIGTGSTDLLLSAYHMDVIPGTYWVWFANAQSDQPVWHKSGYRPGSQVDAAIGTYHRGWHIGRHIPIAPLVQVIGSHRWSDQGALALPNDTGYDRMVVAVGAEIDRSRFQIYADTGFPVLQKVVGNQLVAGEIFELNISRIF